MIFIKGKEIKIISFFITDVILCFVIFAYCLWNEIEENNIIDTIYLQTDEMIGFDKEEIVTGMCTFGDCKVEISETHCTTTEETRFIVGTTVYDENISDESDGDGYYWYAEKYGSNSYEEAFYNYDNVYYSPLYFQKMGEIYWGGWTWTWYSERVLPGYGLNIPGRHTDDVYGYVRDEDDYICLASDSLDYGTVIDTPFGSKGKVYDEVGGNENIIDVYVGW